MKSIILRAAARILAPLMLLFSVFLLLRGHSLPGGGFVGGLIAVTAMALTAISHGPQAVRRAIRIEPRLIAVIGLALALASGLLPGLLGEPVLTGQWAEPFGIPVGTPLLFDVGVYLVVIGAVLAIFLAIEEEWRG